MHGHRKQKTDWSRKRRDGRRYDGGGNPERQSQKPKAKWRENTDEIRDVYGEEEESRE